MKIALFLIMCSAVANECMPPHYFGDYDSYYDCFDAGYTESLRKTKEVGQEQINEYKIYIKFNCIEREEEEAKKGVKTYG
jgi:hypothetical protein